MLFKLSKKKTNGSRNKLLIVKNSLIKFKPLLISYNKPLNKTYNKYRYENKNLNILLKPGEIIGRDKDNFHSNFSILIKFMSGVYTYLPSTYGLDVKTIINFNLFKSSKLLTDGNITLLKFLQPSTIIHNITSMKTKKTAYSRAAGTFATVLMHFANKEVYIKLPSSQIKKLNNNSKAIIGRSDNLFHKFENFGKAGYKKYFGLKPVVRGVAKNAVDHPHGGRTKGGIPKHSP